MILIVFVVGLCAVAAYYFFGRGEEEATDLAGGKTTADFPQVAVDVFRAMDGGIQLTEDEVKGRNTWILWTAGNEQFWDRMARESYGIVDLLKTLDSRQRGTRFQTMGLVNEPGFRQASKPDEFGLWLDEGPQQEGVDPAVYGRSSGILGLRIYPNPEFDAAARARWDAPKFYSDPAYYLDPSLVRPYRVGMTCGFCHIAPHPLLPPSNPEAPEWQNLASLIGNQYFKEGAVFGYDVNRAPEEGKVSTFFYELLQTQPPGTSDTSRIASDHNNNPNAINPIFSVAARLRVAAREELTGGARNVPGGVPEAVPHILKDGADSVGVPGATIRVFVNIGMFHQEWLECHDPLTGLKPVKLKVGSVLNQKPFEIVKARKNSVYWRATEERLDNLVKFFLRIQPMRLADAPRGKEFLTADVETLRRGKLAFADHCARCHSSKRPPAEIAGTAAEANWYREAVLKPDFLEDNFLSDEARKPITQIGTNAGRAVGSNAQTGHVWDNFSSKTYKEQPSVGTIEVYDPLHPEQPMQWQVPAGGPGYYRTPSLISLWTSAPFLHNNALGEFTGDPSVAGRLKAFDDAAEKLLWPEKRPKTIWTTKKESYLVIPRPVLPDFLKVLALEKDDQGNPALKIGPIPAGTPVNLLANLNPEFSSLAEKLERDAKLLGLCSKLKADLLKIHLEKRSPEAAKETMKNLIPGLMSLSKCPDLVEDRGHLFGTQATDEDKKALIAFLKTM
jgi:hypothetical protein